MSQMPEIPADLSDGLEVLLPVVGSWFRETIGEPTRPQRMGWPSIARGSNTLILAPTGSGKTLAAFLACLDHLWRIPTPGRSVRVLYISPLKALNQDISRNLQVPLEGILGRAAADRIDLRALSVGVRSGDTSPAERQRMIRKPPDILITTPESLHLLLTSRARETLRNVSHVIVDEIHALCPNKRGVFLSLLLERLDALNPQGFVRIGLSATQRPLEEVARFLGGFSRVMGADGKSRFEPRPVNIIDAGQRKALDLEIIAPFSPMSRTPNGSVWPVIEDRLYDLIKTHRSTIIFANNRRTVERLTSHLNELATLSENPPAPSNDNASDLARSHHGSLSLQERQATENALKNGELAAVVSTASLELGIDMGAVDLVCQVESPGSVSRGLQRVGRAGHLVGRVSKGRLIAKTKGDLIEAAALCDKMAKGEVEALRVPTNCLDVLAQQIVAAVAMDRWEATALFDQLRQAYPYRDLSAAAFETVLKMISGRFSLDSFRDLRARVSWDRVNNRLSALPGSARLAVVNGGTIPDTGHYPVYLGESGPRLGELDEEFVLERRVGETFVLGTATWRIDAIEPLRVVVGPAEGRSSLMPFWRGEDSPRTAELGEAVGSLCRNIVENRDNPAFASTLRDRYRLDANAAAVLRQHVERQYHIAGAVPDDRTILVESFTDPAGETGLAILTPFGGKLHQGVKLVLQARLRERFGITAACLHSDDGLLFRLPATDEPPLDLFEGVNSDLAESLIRQELGDSALFGLRFRQNAGRALLMPRPDPTKRTPLWLQRLRARDLLEVVRKFPDFPIVVETYRECLNEDLDIPRLRSFLDAIADGSIKVVKRRTELPSPFVSELIFRFELHFMYQWDEPKRKEGASSGSLVDVDLLDSLLDPGLESLWLNANAIGQVESRLRGFGKPPRSSEEMAETLRILGDLSVEELAGPMLGFLEKLAQEGRARIITLSGVEYPSRWISSEEANLYEQGFAESPMEAPNPSLETIVRRYLQTHALVDIDQLIRRYPISSALATDLLESWADDGTAVRLEPIDDEDPRWADPRNLGEVRRLSVALRRRESIAVAPEVYADYLIRHQGLHPETRRQGSPGLAPILEMLQGYAASPDLWELEILPARLRDYRPSWLDETLACGEFRWRATETARGDLEVAFFNGDLPVAIKEVPEPLSEEARQVAVLLSSRGASFATDLARSSGLGPSRLRAALDVLLRRGLVTNDRFDPLRPGANILATALAEASEGKRGGRRRIGSSLSRTSQSRPEGRWGWAVDQNGENDEESGWAWATILLERYGIITRETAALDLFAPPWKTLAAVLARAELAGEVRRGYFVEGLSGVQYATPEATEALAARAADQARPAEPLLISTLDPANLYGSGAPFDINLLEGGTARLPRSPSNFLVLCGGRPVLIIENYGKRLTGLNSASEIELRAAILLMPRLARPSRRVLKVETYNTVATLSGPAVPWLEEAGFVRDYPGMAYYAGC